MVEIGKTLYPKYNDPDQIQDAYRKYMHDKKTKPVDATRPLEYARILDWDNVLETLGELVNTTVRTGYASRLEMFFRQGKLIDANIKNNWSSYNYDKFIKNQNKIDYLKAYSHEYYPVYYIETENKDEHPFTTNPELTPKTLAVLKVNEFWLPADITYLEFKDKSQETKSNELIAYETNHLAVNNQIESIESNLIDIKNFDSDEFKPFVEEYQKKEQEMQLLLNQMYEMQTKMMQEKMALLNKMKQQIFILDVDIYAYQSYWGESVTFTQLKHGLNAPDATPLVIQQKTFFLDEDFHRLASYYKVGDVNSVEELLLQPNVIDHFSHSDKTITFIRNSRHNASYETIDDNRLRRIASHRPNNVAILIRNGGNLWIGWCDEERIAIGEDSFASFASREDNTYDPRSKKFTSRYYLMKIIQGLINRHEIINLPIIVDDIFNSPHIIFSTADNQITDTKYPTFWKLMSVLNNESRKDDPLYILRSLVGSSDKENWHRGKGDSRLTANVHINKDTVYHVSDIVYTNDNRKICIPGDRSSTDMKANFFVYDYEFANMRHLNSKLVDYYIHTKRLSDGNYENYNNDFSVMVNKLIGMKTWLENREKTERDLTGSQYDINLMSSFKLIKNVREITRHQAKRYIKWLETLTDEEKSYYSEYLVVNDAEKYLIDKRYVILINEEAIRLKPEIIERYKDKYDNNFDIFQNSSDRFEHFFAAVETTTYERPDDHWWVKDDIFTENGIRLSSWNDSWSFNREREVKAVRSEKIANEIASKVQSLINDITEPKKYVENSDLYKLATMYKDKLNVFVLPYDEFRNTYANTHTSQYQYRQLMKDKTDLPIYVVDIGNKENFASFIAKNN